MKKQSYCICENGIIRSQSDYGDSQHSSLVELYMEENDFNLFYDFILKNQDESSDAEKPFLLFSKGHKRQIRVKNYVGVVEVRPGTVLEILPKIYMQSSLDQKKQTKKIFYKMLRHLKNSPFVGLSNAHLELEDNFPILEVFINIYLNELMVQLRSDLIHDYVLSQDNSSFLKGKLKVTDNIKKNYLNKSKFFCEFSHFSINIPLNRIVKSTLLKFITISKSYKNITSINRLLHQFSEVPSSHSLERDFESIDISNRFSKRYKSIVDWSRLFLKEKSFTNFAGTDSNLAILFPMERIFEDYIAYLFKKYSIGFKIKTQDKSYFLVSHKTEMRFGLKPDIVANDDINNQKIIDTKWKVLDGGASRRNYNISQADMYQLYAYGKKYSSPDSEPDLILIYPSNNNFTDKLDSFIYEGNLKLEVVPFDLSSDEKEQVEYILKL